MVSRVLQQLIIVCSIVPLLMHSACTESDPTPSGGGEFRIQNGEVSLSGSLLLPKGSGPFPVVISVHGSGRTTRNNNSFIYQGLPGAGIAVLIYDKRGVGNSTGTYEDINAGNSVDAFDKLASDVVAWVDFLSTHTNINASEIGLIGASQAGWIIPLAASRSDKVSFMVNIVGPTVSVGREGQYSFLTQGKQYDVNDKINGFQLTQLHDFVNAFQGFQGYEPQPVLEALSIPGLWIYGRLDESIPTSNCVLVLEEMIQKEKPFEYRVYENGTHAMQDNFTKAPIPFMTSTGGVIDWIKATVAN